MSYESKKQSEAEDKPLSSYRPKSKHPEAEQNNDNLIRPLDYNLHFYSNLLNNMPVIVMAINPDTSIRYLNHTFERVTGYSSRELIGQKAPYPWWPEERLESAARELRAFLRRRSVSKEASLISKDGKTLRLEISSNRLKDDLLNRYILITAFEVTESRQLQDSMRAYITQVTKLQQSEHEHFARELHEEVLQSLAALKLAVEAINIKKEDNPEILTPGFIAIEDKIDSIMNKLRQLSHTLSPGVLEYLGLVSALEELIRDINRRRKTRITFTVDGTERKMPPNVGVTLYRITQEALKNAHQHSQATDINVKLRFSPKKVKLVIADNGKGFTVPEKLLNFANLGKIGLINMENWSLMLNGKMTIDTPSDGGTVISIEVKA